MTHPTINIRHTTPSDFAQVLALNEESVRFLSPMNGERLALLHSQAAYHCVVEANGQVGAFLMAHRNCSAYDSENFAWFAKRYADFLYIDRIAVSSTLHGQGIGGKLYEHFFAFARSQGIPIVTCEFDIEPPNRTSEKFHASLGFEQVGSQTYGVYKKRVAMQAITL